MISPEGAFLIAKLYVHENENKDKTADFYVDIRPGKDFFDYYYFDFTVTFKPGKRKGKVAGAAGIIVDKMTGMSRAISVPNWGTLAKKERSINGLYKLLVGLKEDDPYLFNIKRYYGLDTEELLELKRTIKNGEVTKLTAKLLVEK